MKIINTLSRIMNIAASAVLAAMMLLTVSDVVLRYFLKKPILGATEITESMMACLAFLALAWCAAERSHLKVDLVVARFSPRVQAAMDSLTLLAGLAVVAVMAWRSLVEGLAVRQLNIVSSLIRIPAYPFYFVIALGAAMLSLVIAAQLIQNLSRAVKG